MGQKIGIVVDHMWLWGVWFLPSLVVCPQAFLHKLPPTTTPDASVAVGSLFSAFIVGPWELLVWWDNRNDQKWYFFHDHFSWSLGPPLVWVPQIGNACAWLLPLIGHGYQTVLSHWIYWVIFSQSPSLCVNLPYRDSIRIKLDHLF